MDYKGKYYPLNKLFLLTGEQLNVVIWACELLVGDFPPHSEGREALEDVLKRLKRKDTYDNILDKMGMFNGKLKEKFDAPSEADIKAQDGPQTFDEFLREFGIKRPPEDGESERN